MSRDKLSLPCPFRQSLETLETRWVPASVGSANQNFVDQLYRDVLHRAPDPASAGWVSSLDAGGDRADVVDGILNSEEGLRNQVNDLYVRFLGRSADAGGLSFWTDYLRDEDNTNLDLAARLISSEEYYQTRGGGTDLGFLNAVYEDVLCRPIGGGEVEDRGDDFDDGAEDRFDIAEGILGSGEAEDVRNVHSAQSFLRANLTADQAEDLVGDLGGDDDEGDWVFAPGMLVSEQYYAQAQSLPTTAFATIPSCDNVEAEPLA